ncbi:MAG: CCA tRNA nucleotidyltransferase, partial [Chthoniobacterales bacterium]|nr:CCA tRNA nucleotidyltransferase [Chthoniobacterales bacterium]
MTLNLPSTPPCLAAISIIQKLQNDGFQALLAGGCVRDLLLNRTPHDFDVATSAPPHVILHSFPNTVHVGLQFGVVIVVQNGIQTQVATFRSDGSYLDGRHPSTVHFSDPQSDALRRDFTINGLFYDPIAHKLLDFVGGQHDLK